MTQHKRQNNCCIKHLFCQFLTTVMPSGLHLILAVGSQTTEDPSKISIIIANLPPSNASTSDLNITLVYCTVFSPTYQQGLFSYSNVTGYIGRNWPHRLYVSRIRTNYGKR